MHYKGKFEMNATMNLLLAYLPSYPLLWPGVAGSLSVGDGIA